MVVPAFIPVDRPSRTILQRSQTTYHCTEYEHSSGWLVVILAMQYRMTWHVQIHGLVARLMIWWFLGTRTGAQA